MLRELHITGLGVIDEVDLEPHDGLTVLTGETGAGKTMITVAIGLATGARASAQLVRPGSPAARVQARFDAPEDDDGWSEDGEVVLARTVGADGRSGARIGGQIATAGALGALGGRLVEIHGQHQSVRLLEAATQTAFLDRLAGAAHLATVTGCGTAFTAWRAAAAELRRLREADRDREREIDLLTYQVREIEAVAPRAGESDALRAEEQRLGHVERLQELSAAADAALGGEDGGAGDRTAAAARAIADAAALDPDAEELSARAAAVAVETSELARDLRAYAGGLAADPDRLAALRERLGALRGLQRKYGADDGEVVAFLATAGERLLALTGADERAEELAEEVANAEGAYLEAAAAVTRGREEAAPLLAAALAAEVRELGMPDAEVAVDLAPVDPGPAGVERAVVRLSAGEGQPSLPLERAASGGELSRVMLACRSIAADLDDVGTLVFDEVDAGIGGQAGLAVGARLARLATARQVVVVTHLPQIACFADRHVRVRKEAGVATVEVLDDSERRVELSRMLAGLESTAHGVSHADELLAAAASLRAPVSA
ncbi:MAG TPA: DNA repair protein RecN [Actinomycetota bacterium]|nr:DNA repair protein RecN [Actinomycetota bacterium]